MTKRDWADMAGKSWLWILWILRANHDDTGGSFDTFIYTYSHSSTLFIQPRMNEPQIVIFMATEMVPTLFSTAVWGLFIRG